MSNTIKLTNAPLQNISVKNTNGIVVGATDHSKLTNRDLPDQHPISAITGLQEELDSLSQVVIYTPSVSSSGVISWTNNGGLTNPKSVNIKGAKGDKGDKGEQGIQGVQGKQGVSGVYVGTGDMPSGYNVQIDPSGTTDNYTKTVVVNTRHLDDCTDTSVMYKVLQADTDGKNTDIVKGFMFVSDDATDFDGLLMPIGLIRQTLISVNGISYRTWNVNDDAWTEWTEYATKSDLTAQIGDIDTALDNIIAIQNELIGGGTA